MALIACEECGQPISQSASTCPHCGGRTRHARQIMGAVVGSLLGLIVLYVLGLTLGQLDRPAPRLNQPLASSAAAAAKTP